MLSKEEVLGIAKLARLQLTDQETEKMQKDLSAILDYFNLLKKAKIVKKSSSKKLVKQDNGLRKDKAEAKPASLATNLIAQAPDKKDDYIKVKAIL